MADEQATTTSLETLHEHINSPITVISRLFDEYKADIGENVHQNNGFGKLVKSRFEDVFGSQEAIERIPAFDRTGRPGSLKNGTLVRFRCMVQDPSYGEELHLSVAHIVNSETGEAKQKFSQYTDADHVLDEGWEVDYNAPGNVFTEKEVAYCVSVPGQTEWAQPESSGTSLEGALESMSISADAESSGYDETSQFKYPLRGEKHASALVKFYAPSTAPKVLSVVDIVGIYELGFNMKDQGEENDARMSWPCIHSLYHSSVGLEQLVPGLPRPVASDYADRRRMCVAHLSSVLGDDELAAQYLLLHLLSKTVPVQDAKVGKFSLNLIGFPGPSKEQTHLGTFSLSSATTEWVSNAISQLVPRNVEIPFDLKLLNGASFVPNAESGDLRAGVLQLAPDTQIICDETCLHEGTLGEQGVRNLQALQTVILDQTVSYVYPYQSIEMASNLRVLVLSTGKSILQNDCDLYLSGPTVQFLSAIQDGKPTDLKPLDPMHTEQLRQYLESARHLDFGVPKDVSDAISSEYAELRRKAHDSGSKMMSQTELALTVTVARLVSISKGESELTMDSWKDACALEERRAGRNQKHITTTKSC
ncbi:hypothetical protein IW140_000313 [Coemansia sp. RSA 1813]|nr:hypothetical protein EV178_000513 [Coemansia sp. RSA 1646]KAJ1773719.1 hypothetical protein LPJ74_000262 [Coemansia sp. RSA 1843]KAJ2093680.1 hypothetical protein IW138_000075 [Coemansia sp. RSA 986]KAJ2217893.1 hypothetical protein EV179_000037 [Coemansia sp. RSA 487]KAJ2573269.1 hypothetical protein IW140_000313 [Coemansia sp. RSA 1813]